MTVGTVLVLPGLAVDDEPPRSSVLHPGSPAIEIVAVPGPEAALSARICAAITLLRPTGPLRIVAFGPSALFLPSVALAQRTAHRRIEEYVLVVPELPSSTDHWPDADVRVFAPAGSVAARLSELRGWQTAPVESLVGWVASLSEDS